MTLAAHRAYQSPRSLRSTHVQSILASSGLRKALVRRRAAHLLKVTNEEIITVLGDIRLKALVSEHPQPRGSAFLLHGWEGHAGSSYLTELAGRLFGMGYNVVRLNFRDHGDTQHLNPGIFHSCRIDEVVAAAALFASRWEGLPYYVAGYSLGGNFALRIGLRALFPVRHVFAVSPVINPAAGLESIELAPFVYERYFMRKWLNSIRSKCALYPDQYRWDPKFARSRLRELTAWLVERYTEFGHIDAYLDGYAINGDRLMALQAPATIITAADDPVIPVDDFLRLQLPPHARLMITPHGGHCGFLTGWTLNSWAAEHIAGSIDAQVRGEDPMRPPPNHRDVRKNPGTEEKIRNP